MDSGLRREAVAFIADHDLIDLHVDGMIPHRLFGYDLNHYHQRSYTGGRFMGHLDFPRAMEHGLRGAMWSITTNPFRTPAGRWRSFLLNLERLRGQVTASGGAVEVVTTWADYQSARARARHLCLPAIQGGNALAGAPGGCADIPGGAIVRVTLVHLTNSLYGVTSSPLKGWRGARGLSPAGRDLVTDLNRNRIFVDLAHINKRGFWDAVAIHDPTQPLLVTHTGVEGVRPHWRNLDDDQVRAVADTGGTVGVIFEKSFLRRSGGPRDGEMVLEHLLHIINLVGEDHASLGSDYDGMISPPEGLGRTPGYVPLVEAMLAKGWGSERIAKITGTNFLRCFRSLRPA